MHQPEAPELSTQPQAESSWQKASALSELYETDFMAWCEHQVGALQDRKFDQLDLVHLVEEINDMGREQFNKTKSLTRQIIAHILKLQALPEDPSANLW